MQQTTQPQPPAGTGRPVRKKRPTSAFGLDQRELQAAFKEHTPYFTQEARTPGMYGRTYRFCVPAGRSVENLYEGIRADTLDYFAEKGIAWHDDQGRLPSNHLLDSQVCCLNFLYPFVHRPDALAELLRPHYPVKQMLPIEDTDRFVTFEYIGEHNYLGEHVPDGKKRVRGQFCTSADAAVRFQRTDGRTQIVLIEWKFTESYSSESKRYSTNRHRPSREPTDRTEIYRHLFSSPQCPLNRRVITAFDDLFYDPFDQLMRQQFLAGAMEQVREKGADLVTTLLVCPRANRAFQRVTAPNLRRLGETVAEVWHRIAPERFADIATENLFGPFPIAPHPDLHPWWTYVTERYGWVTNTGPHD